MTSKSQPGAAASAQSTKVSVSAAITSQVLAEDTGASSTDGITSNGAVTLAGTYSGPAGTTVGIYDGSTVLGYAKLDGKGHWSFATVLGSGSHTLHAVARDIAGHSFATANQPTIVVDATTPTVTVRYENQTVGTNTVQLWGTVSGSPGTTVEIYSGSRNLGPATVSGGEWTFNTAALAPGNYSFTAVATTPAGKSGSTGALPSLTVGQVAGSLNPSAFATVWSQDFTASKAIDTSIFPLFWGNAQDVTFGSGGITLTAKRSEGFANIGFQQPDWGANLAQGYGLYSVTASTPAGQGGGVALLLWPSNNVWPGPEIDILENWTDPTGQTGTFSIHYKGPGGQDVANVITFHADLTKPLTYALDWEQGSLTYYIDGQEIFQVTGSEVPADAAHGGVNAAFGCEIADITPANEPADQVSVTIANISYAAPRTQSGAASTHAASSTLTNAASLLDAPSLGTGWSSAPASLSVHTGLAGSYTYPAALGLTGGYDSTGLQASIGINPGSDDLSHAFGGVGHTLAAGAFATTGAN